MSYELMTESVYTDELEDEPNLRSGNTTKNVHAASGPRWESRMGMPLDNGVKFQQFIPKREPVMVEDLCADDDEERRTPQRRIVQELASMFRESGPAGKVAEIREKLKKCKVQFEADDNDDNLKAGDGLDFHQRVQDDDWWKGSLKTKRGVLPPNFMEFAEDNSSTDESSIHYLKKKDESLFSECAVVRFSYTAAHPDELSLVEGQIVRVIDKELLDEGWWKGEINGKVGVFPNNFVELLLGRESNKPSKVSGFSVPTRQSSLLDLPERGPIENTSDETVDTETNGSEKESAQMRETSSIMDIWKSIKRTVVRFALETEANPTAPHPILEAAASSDGKKPLISTPARNYPLNERTMDSPTLHQQPTRGLRSTDSRFVHQEQQNGGFKPMDSSTLHQQPTRGLRSTDSRSIQLEQQDGGFKPMDSSTLLQQPVRGLRSADSRSIQLEQQNGGFKPMDLSTLLQQPVRGLRSTDSRSIQLEQQAGGIKSSDSRFVHQEQPAGDFEHTNSRCIQQMSSSGFKPTSILFQQPTSCVRLTQSRSVQHPDCGLSPMVTSISPQYPTSILKDRILVRENYSENYNTDGCFPQDDDDTEPHRQKKTLIYGQTQGTSKCPLFTVVPRETAEGSSGTRSNRSPSVKKRLSTINQQGSVLNYRRQLESQLSPVVSHLPPHSPRSERRVFSRAHSPKMLAQTAASQPYPKTASIANINKLLEQLQHEVSNLKDNCATCSAFSDLQQEHNRLRTNFDNLKKNHSARIRDLSREVDEEKRLRLSEQDDVEFVRRFAAKGHI